MSEFNKEQLNIFIHNFFTVIGIFSSFHILSKSYKYFSIGENYNGSLELFFGSVIGITSMWLLLSAVNKGVTEFIEIHFPNGFEEIFERFDGLKKEEFKKEDKESGDKKE